MVEKKEILGYIGLGFLIAAVVIGIFSVLSIYKIFDNSQYAYIGMLIFLLYAKIYIH